MQDKPKDPMEKNEKWVEVGSFQGPVFAEMAKDTLEQNNIPCLLNKTFLSSAIGVHSTNTPGMTVKIMVPASKIAECREILATISDEWEDK